MKRITILRSRKGWSRAELGRRSRIHPARIGQAENGRVVPYPVEMARIAHALEWTDDSADLLQEVDDERS